MKNSKIDFGEQFKQFKCKPKEAIKHLKRVNMASVLVHYTAKTLVM